ncbi:hypothetical protein BH11PSE11_BH11PSE11_28530 [soil metagenome]
MQKSRAQSPARATICAGVRSAADAAAPCDKPTAKASKQTVTALTVFGCIITSVFLKGRAARSISVRIVTQTKPVSTLSRSCFYTPPNFDRYKCSARKSVSLMVLIELKGITAIALPSARLPLRIIVTKASASL